MVYFKCSQCNRIWSKLVDDGCIRCQMPCEVLNWSPTQGSSMTRQEIDPGDINVHHNEQMSIVQNQSKTHSTMTESVSGEQRPRSLSDFDVEGRFEALFNTAPEQPTSSGTFAKFLKRSQPATRGFRKASLDSDRSIIHSPRLPSDSSDADTGLYPHLLEDLRISETWIPDTTTPSTSTADILTREDDSTATTDEEPKRSPVQNKGVTPLPLNPVSTNKSKKKKSHKNSPKKQKNKSGQSQTSQEKIVAQLELPDPIPVKKPITGEGWNQVVDKKVAKRSSRLEVAAHKGREVNASPYLARQAYKDDENEVPAARVVRFGLGGAKHDIKSTVPRETFEF